jgi:hypothetical protein
MRLTRIAFGQPVLIAEGDPENPQDIARLSEAFTAEIESGAFAFVPLGLDLCCHRGLVVDRFEDVPTGAPAVRFLQRQG